MAIQLTLDEALVEEAKAVGEHPTEVAAVMTALKEYIARHKQAEIIELFGMIEYESSYDYKAQRQVT